MGSTLADRIRMARRLSGLSQSAASQLLEVHRGTFGHWERGGGHQPTSANLLRLAVIFDVSYEWLATGRGAICATQPGTDRGPSGDEEHLLNAFRRLPRSRRSAVVDFAQSLAGRKLGWSGGWHARGEPA